MNTDKCIGAGISGSILAFVLTIVINLVLTLPDILIFVPPFFAAIFTIYASRLDNLKDGLVASFMTYVFNEGILGTISLAAFFFINESYPSFNVDILTVFYPIVNAISAFIAGYIGIWLVHKTKSTRELTPPPPLPPPMQPV